MQNGLFTGAAVGKPPVDAVFQIYGFVYIIVKEGRICFIGFQRQGFEIGAVVDTVGNQPAADFIGIPEGWICVAGLL